MGSGSPASLPDPRARLEAWADHCGSMTACVCVTRPLPCSAGFRLRAHMLSIFCTQFFKVRDRLHSRSRSFPVPTSHPGPADCSACGPRTISDPVLLCADCRAPPGKILTFCANCMKRSSVTLDEILVILDRLAVRPKGTVALGDTVRLDVCPACATRLHGCRILHPQAKP